MAKGRKTGGRKKGTPNKVTGTFKASLLEAFNMIGGTEELARWGAEPKNRGLFYGICRALIPTEIQGSDDPDAAPIQHITRHIYDTPPPK